MIYIVEDDANIRELVIYTLQSTGFDAGGYESGISFFKDLWACLLYTSDAADE